MSLLEIFCDVDDFMIIFDEWFKTRALTQAPSKRGRKSTLSMSEVMTIIIWFHQSHYRDFKTFYLEYVCPYLRSEFPNLVSYNRFVELMPGTLLPLCVYLYLRRGHKTGIAFVDSTPIAVCHNKRIRRHKTFASLARRGKSTMGYYYGFKLHLVVNDQGEILAFCLTRAMSMTGCPCLLWRGSCGANWSVIKAISAKTSSINCLPRAFI